MTTSSQPTNWIKYGINAIITIVVIGVLIAPGVLAWFGGTRWIAAQRAQCDLIESGLGQLNPDETGNPQTAEQCKSLVNLGEPFTRTILICISYIFTIVLGGIALFGAWVLLRLRRKTTSNPA